MFNITGHTASDTWMQILDQLLSNGKLISPRGIPCYEIINAHTEIPMRKPIVTIPQRKIGYRFMFAEAYWILSGSDRVETIIPYSPMIGRFSDNGITFYGAYGPKIINQIKYVVETLASDQNSRQAVMTIWRENPPKTRDVPCTVSVQFLIRDGKLHCIDTMRSSDAWLGWPYDTFNFTMLSSLVLLLLNSINNITLELGNLYMNLGSLHLYKSNVEQARLCYQSDNKDNRKFRYAFLDPIQYFHTPSGLFQHLRAVAENKPDDLMSDWCICIARGEHNK